MPPEAESRDVPIRIGKSVISSVVVRMRNTRVAATLRRVCCPIRGSGVPHAHEAHRSVPRPARRLLYVVKAIAPLIVVGVIGLVVLAWKRPETVIRLAARPQLERVAARGAGRGTGSGNRNVGTGPDPGTHAGAAASADAGSRRDPSNCEPSYLGDCVPRFGVARRFRARSTSERSTGGTASTTPRMASKAGPIASRRLIAT
jgi:hypothetical protein